MAVETDKVESQSIRVSPRQLDADPEEVQMKIFCRGKQLDQTKMRGGTGREGRGVEDDAIQK